MSLFNMFKPSGSNKQESNNQGNNQGNNNQQQGNQQQPNNGNAQGNMQGNNNTAVPNNGMLDGMAGGNNNTQSQQAENPLDSFKGMFDNKGTDGDKAPSFSLPQDILDKVSSSQNFLAGVNEELIQKAMSGDAKSFLDVINAATQNSYKSSLSHMSALSDQFMNSRLEHEGKSFGSKVKQELTTSELSANVPGFNHPVVKAQLSEVAKSLAKQHPDATPQEIAAKAKDYIIQMANAINPQTKSDADNEKASSTDWDTFFN